MQGGSVLQSGGRALLISSKITKALSTMTGRFGAWAFMAMGINQKFLNYVAFRPYAMNEAVRLSLPEGVENPFVVDPAAGYSPQMIWLAEEMPHVQILELDRHATRADKTKRLRDITLPKNLTMQSADLSTTPLHEVIGERKIDVILANGAYVDAKDFMELLTYLHGVLSDKGAVVAYFPYRPGIKDIAKSQILFERFAGDPKGIVASKEHARALFTQTGYTNIQFYELSQLATKLNKPIPADIEIIAIAKRK